MTDGRSKTMVVAEILVVPDDASGWATGNNAAVYTAWGSRNGAEATGNE